MVLTNENLAQRLRRFADRETAGQVPDDDAEYSGRPIVVTLGQGCLIVRAKGCRRRFKVPLAKLWQLGRRLEDQPLFADAP